MIILPTAYFPPVSYMVKATSGQPVFIEHMETWPKQTYRNRCEIMTAGGIMNLIVPVSKPYGNHTKTGEILISRRQPWQKHHWKSILTAYRSSPYFNYYADLIYPLFLLPEEQLTALNARIFQSLCQIAGLTCEFSGTTSYVREVIAGEDLRNAFKPGKMAGSFILEKYPQVFGHLHGYLPDLSILDLLFNLGPDLSAYLNLAAKKAIQSADG